MARAAKGPGRPAAHKRGPGSREALIAAASSLYAAHGADRVSLRRVAEAARVSPAMIHYHFKDKRGLMRAVLERGLDRIVEIVKEVAAHPEVSVTDTFIDRYMHALEAEPSLPQLMVREVLARNSPYRQVIAQRFVQKVVNVMPPRIVEEIAAGRLRSDLDPRLTMISLVGMCVFPFLAGPLLSPAMGYEFDRRFVDLLMTHTKKLFNEGAVPKQ